MMLSLFEYPVLGRGFRAFFLLGALYSVISILIWGGYYSGYVSPPSFLLDPVSWHAHEMIYGFTMAIVAGFLLTAVANWTGHAPVRKLNLLALCLLWISGRVVMGVDLGLPSVVAFAIDGAFIPALAISLSIPLLKSWNKRNFVFLVLLTILFICNITFFIMEELISLYVAILVIITMISLIGGRIIPAFSVAALRRRGEEAYQSPQKILDVIALISLLFIIVYFSFLGTHGIVVAIFAFASAVIHLIRMRVYKTRLILNDPMVWILHAGYGWVIIGLLLMGIASLGGIPLSMAMHALTAGAIGSMTLGMMCRVALGHTGRNLITTKLTKFIFIMIQVVAVMRVFGPVILSDYNSLWIIGSALLWALCYLIYLVAYSQMLWTKRPDGRGA